MSFAGGSEGQESSYNEGGLDSTPWSGGFPAGNLPTPVFLPREPHGQRSLAV